MASIWIKQNTTTLIVSIRETGTWRSVTGWTSPVNCTVSEIGRIYEEVVIIFIRASNPIYIENYFANEHGEEVYDQLQQKPKRHETVSVERLRNSCESKAVGWVVEKKEDGGTHATAASKIRITTPAQQSWTAQGVAKTKNFFAFETVVSPSFDFSLDVFYWVVNQHLETNFIQEIVKRGYKERDSSHSWLAMAEKPPDRLHFETVYLFQKKTVKHEQNSWSVCLI